MNYYTPNIGEKSVPDSFDMGDVNWNYGLLIRSSNWLGDSLMTLPAIYKLKCLLPDKIRLGIVSHEKLRPLWENIPWIDHIYSFANKRLDPDCIQAIKLMKPDVSVIFPNSFGSVWDIWNAGLANIIGRSGRGRTLFLTHKLPQWKRTSGTRIYHEIRKYLEIAMACGAEEWDCNYPSISAKLTDEEFNDIKAGIATLKNILVIAPGAAYGPAKQWPTRAFNEIAKWWTESHGDVISVGSENEQDIASQSIANCSRAISMAGITSLSQLMYVLSRAKLVLSNDSGSMHLAAALGKKGVAIFGSTDPTATGPIGGQWIVHYKNVPCSPCFARNCKLRENQYNCLNTITPEEVIVSLTELMNI